MRNVAHIFPANAPVLREVLAELTACSLRFTKTGGAAMTTDQRDILELLKDELDFIEKGGYGRSVRTPWQSKSTFQDSLSCINYNDPNRTHSCNECRLLDFVTPEHKTEEIPCHFIPLNNDGETIEDLELQDNQAKLEREVSEWLRARIKQIETKHGS